MTTRENDERRLQQARELLAKHGCRAARRGNAWLVYGPGVHLLVADLGQLTRQDLLPTP